MTCRRLCWCVHRKHKGSSCRKGVRHNRFNAASLVACACNSGGPCHTQQGECMPTQTPSAVAGHHPPTVQTRQEGRSAAPSGTTSSFAPVSPMMMYLKR